MLCRAWTITLDYHGRAASTRHPVSEEMTMPITNYGYWLSLTHFRAANPTVSVNQALAYIRLGQLRIGKPRLYAHQTAELNDAGRWIIKMQDQRSCAQILPVPNPVSTETANKFNKSLPLAGNYNNI